MIGVPSPGEREVVERIGLLDFAQAEYGEEHARRWEDFRVKARAMSAVRRAPMGRMRCSHAAARKADSDPPR